jgi:hypothetical protein
MRTVTTSLLKPVGSYRRRNIKPNGEIPPVSELGPVKEHPIEHQKGVSGCILHDRSDGAIIHMIERACANRFAARERRQ